ncbi:hypothetical protein MTO96_044625 [Rhipicephalus appendiculatus]
MVAVCKPRIKQSSGLQVSCDTGLGHILARQLAAEGFFVYAGCLSAAGEGAKILRAKTNIEVLQMDVTKDDDVEAAYEVVERTLGKRGRMSMPASMTYCMSKHASTSLADSLRRQYYDRGVHVSTVEPGAYRTPMANHDTMAETLRKDLTLLPPRVRSGISDHSLGSLRKSSDTLYSSIMRDDSQEAVDVMKSAVRDLIPKAYYRAGGLKDIFLRRLYEVAPAEVTDEVVHMIRKVARAARRKA